MKHAELLTFRFDLLREHGFTAGMNDEHLEALYDCAAIRTIANNEYLLRQGETFDQLLMVCSGEISLEISLPLQGPCRIESIGPGEVLGTSWLTPSSRWPFDARAVRPVTAIAIDGRRLRQACELDNTLGYELLKRLLGVTAERLQNTRRRLLDGFQTTKKMSR